MKIAVAGKGGVGKTTVCAALAILYARKGKNVITVDADPSPNLALALGVDQKRREGIVPLSKMLDIIEERTGARPGETSGGMFSLNPKVDDLIDRFGVDCIEGIKLIVLGTVRSGGGGCFCPENSLLRAVVRHLMLRKNEVLIMDMEAGVEHLGRSTAQNVDAFLVIVEPSMKSIETAGKIKDLAGDIGLKHIFVALNKYSTENEKTRVSCELKNYGLSLIGALHLDECVIKADFDGISPFQGSGCGKLLQEVQTISKAMEGANFG